MRSTGARVGTLIVLVAVAVGLFIVLSGNDDDNGGGGSGSTTSATDSTGSNPSGGTTITVQDDKPVGGIQTIEVSKGDQVHFTVISKNVSDEVHVHGYDLMQDVAPGKPVTFDFTADIEGVFEAELEDAHAQILELRVNP
jgi:FtsP/CotA-like multicopper oxidase with cupredoxin domain